MSGTRPWLAQRAGSGRVPRFHKFWSHASPWPLRLCDTTAAHEREKHPDKRGHGETLFARLLEISVSIPSAVLGKLFSLAKKSGT